MIYTSKEIKEKYNDYYNINKAIERKEIFRLEHSLYSDSENINPLVKASVKHHNAIITLNSAFYYYKLIDIESNQVYLATSRNSDKIKDENIIQMGMENKILNIGKVSLPVDGNMINIYDRERLLIELIRKRWQMDYDYYKLVINNYRKIAKELDKQKLKEYAPSFYNGKSILDKINKEVF